jgi:hypothetical protein
MGRLGKSDPGPQATDKPSVSFGRAVISNAGIADHLAVLPSCSFRTESASFHNNKLWLIKHCRELVGKAALRH